MRVSCSSVDSSTPFYAPASPQVAGGVPMPDHHEIEIKFVLSDPQQVRTALIQLGAKSSSVHQEYNIRLDDRERALAARGIVLRLRRIEAGGETRHILTVKTPIKGGDPALSTRREIELEVDDADAMLEALAVLGFEPYWSYEKRRESFRRGGVMAEIDETPIGWFLEIEGSPEIGRALAGALGLDMAQGIRESYAQLFAKVQRT